MFVTTFLPATKSPWVGGWSPKPCASSETGAWVGRWSEKPGAPSGVKS